MRLSPIIKLVKSIFVSSITSRSGKTVITLGLALNSKVFTGFFKPFQEKMITVNGQQVEEDAYLMQSVIDFEASPAELCPFPRESIPSLTMGQVMEAYGRVSKNKELMIVEGVEHITAGFLYGLSGFDIVERLKSDMILLSNTDPESLDRLAMMKHYMDYRGIPLKGVILNFATTWASRTSSGARASRCWAPCRILPRSGRSTCSRSWRSLTASFWRATRT